MLGKSFNEVKADPNANPLNLDIRNDEENGKLESLQTWEVQLENGKSLWLETYTQTIRDDNNAVQEIYSYSRDVTQEKQEENQLRILNVLGESKDSEAFLRDMIQELRGIFNAEACIHIHSSNPNTLSYCIYKKDILPDTLKLHRQICKETDQDTPQFQGQNARGVFHHLHNIENVEALITQPIPDTFGRAIGKITITSPEKIHYSERTRAIMTLFANKVGCVLEEHTTRV
jgi:hypothetical protein